MAAHGHHEHPGHGGHAGHAVLPSADRRWLMAAIALLTTFMAGEVVVALVTGSLVLLSDAGHMLTDIAALVVALVAFNLSARPAVGAWTFGWKRAEIVGALINAVTLVGIGLGIAMTAVQRLIVGPDDIEAKPVLVVALVGVAVNLVGTWMVARAQSIGAGGNANLNMAGAYQHMLSDLYAFAGAVIAATVILTTGWMAADAVASLVVAALMIWAGVPLVKSSLRILMEVAPSGLELDGIRAHLLEVEHVVDVHELHVWQLSTDLPTLSAHLVVEDECFSDGHAPGILDQVQACLGDHFDLTHSTFQIEPRAHVAHEDARH